MARQQDQQQANLEKFVQSMKAAKEGDQKNQEENQEQQKSLGNRAWGYVKEALADAKPAALGFLNQGRMEAAHCFGKAFPESPQFDDPAAAFNRTPLEGYQLKHGTGPYATQAMEMNRSVPEPTREGPEQSVEPSRPEKQRELETDV